MKIVFTKNLGTACHGAGCIEINQKELPHRMPGCGTIDRLPEEGEVLRCGDSDQHCYPSDLLVARSCEEIEKKIRHCYECNYDELELHFSKEIEFWEELEYRHVWANSVAQTYFETIQKLPEKSLRFSIPGAYTKL